MVRGKDYPINLTGTTKAPPRYTTAVNLFAIAPTTIPPFTFANVEVRFEDNDYFKRAAVDEDTWGIVQDAENFMVVVATGVTCLTRGATDTHHGCRVFNGTSVPVVVGKPNKNGQVRPIAHFIEMTDDYTIAEADDWEAEAAHTANTVPYGVHDIRRKLADPCNENGGWGDVPLTGIEMADLEEQWAEHKHLHPIDIMHVKKRLPQSQYDRLRLLLIKHQVLWDQRPKETPPGVETCSFKVKLGARFKANMRPMGEPARLELSKQTAEQQERNIIEPSTSEFSSAIVLIPKKGGGVRFAIDYRALNKSIVADEYTLPNVQEGLAALGGDRTTPPHYFSAVDVKEAFWSVPLDEDCRKYTAFQTPDGLKQYRRMPMGLKTASAVFCRYIDKILGNMKWTKVLAYIDDLLIFGRHSAEDHMNDLDALFTKLRASNLTLGANKCILLAERVKYLGHIVSSEGVSPDPSKVTAIEAIADKPPTAEKLHSAMGLIAYYRKFIQNFAMFARPIYAKIKRTADWPKNEEPVYSDIEASNFVRLRDALKGEQVLAHPDWTRPFELHTDACKLGLGAVIVQKVGTVHRPISFASRSLTKAEMNYSQWELECLAIVWAMRLFRMYLALAEFLVVTDATAAKRIMEGSKNDAGRVVRWALAVQEFDYTIVQRPASALAAPDGLSRYSHVSTEPYSEGETTVEPSTWLTTVRPSNAFFSGTFFNGVNGHDQERTEPYDEGGTFVEPSAWLTPMRPDGTYEAFFGNEDHTAETVEEWRLLQNSDEWCKRKLAKACEVSHEALPGDLYVGTTGLLYRKSLSGKAADQVLVPVGLRAYILNRYHGLPVTGHMGRRRTHDQVSAFFWWQGMYKDVAKWVAACLACKKRKTPRNMHAGAPSAVSTATHPWETVALDIVSAKPSKEGYVKILTILDTFTRYVITVPLRSKTAEEISKALMNSLFCVFGRPDSILTDDGKEFLNTALQAVNKRWGVHHHSTGGYQPHALPVERYHRFLNSAMTTLSMTFGDDWPSYLPAATFAYNASTNDATGYSPYELVMAKGSPVLLQHIELQPKPAAGAALGDSMTDFYKQAGNRIMAAYAHVRDQQQRIMKQRNEAIMARRGVRQRKMVTYDIGDSVLFWEPRQSMKDMEAAVSEASWAEKPPAKWTYNWSGPHMLIGKDAEASGFRYTFYHDKRKQLIETHSNKLAVFEPWSEGILSTSIGIDAKRNYQAGEWAPIGELALVPMMAPEPFGIGESSISRATATSSSTGTATRRTARSPATGLHGKTIQTPCITRTGRPTPTTSRTPQATTI